MKQKRVKKTGSFLLAGAIVLMLFPTFLTEVHAAGNELPAKEQFATVGELKEFNTNDNDGMSNPAKVYFGKDSQQWWIAGSQGDMELTLFAASPLETNQQFEPNRDQNKTYSADWGCNYASTGGTAPTNVSPNHYGASPLRTTLQELEKSHFSDEEQKLMNDTTIYTDDTQSSSVYSTTNKLYLAYGHYNDHLCITVGKNASDSLNNGLRIDMSYWGNDRFWLRAPGTAVNNSVRAAWPGREVYNAYVDSQFLLMPAFELDLSSVIFASAASAASSDGTLSENDAFTLRYGVSNLGSALVSYSKEKITLSGVPSSTYLVVQNSDGAWAKQITAETSVVTPVDINSSLNSFENCQVWLETTDTTNRMTYATLATEEQGYDVNITAGDGLTVKNGMQGVGQGNAITDITVEVTDEYFLPEGYIARIQGLNGLTATETDNGFTISGTPKSDVNITLPAATKKVYDITVTGSGTFTTVCKGYQPITANEFIITNNGNFDLENVNVSLTGNDADKFELSVDNTTIIQPNGTTKVTVKPNDDLGVGIHQAKLSVSADNAAERSIDLQFTVSEHDYNTVATQPTCTEKGYTTYTCKKCNHSYAGDEVAAKGHTFGEWKVIKDATTAETGTKERYCARCDYKETESIPVISKPAQPNDNNSDKNNPNSDTYREIPKTGVQTNAGLFTALLSISAFSIAVLTVLKKKKA